MRIPHQLTTKGCVSTFPIVGIAVTRCDEAAQAFIDVEAPCARAFTVAFDLRYQADMGEAELGLLALRRDVEDDVSTVPLILVLDEIDLRVAHVPYDFLARHEFSDLLGAAMEILVPISKLGAKLVGVAINVTRPPGAHIGDGVKDLFRRLVDRNGRGVIPIGH
jgi:hypothetical protein